ncbi:sulfatase-like hydrolase/transferase [Tenacibaculum agarivorans]|uniref:sulfatase-like hydrolase/transferase n=1 Tax=Tenacibaculum agarivorans TaxID=1908389 RepID=UPI00094B97AC|nr:sulfatase-like hydrolase/transferase [Tenacibaculum agarivorans]
MKIIYFPRLLTVITFLMLTNCTFSKKTDSDSNKHASKNTVLNTETQKSVPNILLILCDDLGYSDVGFNGAKDIKTPALDNLAENGTILTSAYVAHPFCGPSRTSIMTGRYAHKIGGQFNLPRAHQNAGLGVTTKEQYISKTLQKAGYYTGAVGKWHLGTVQKYHPNNRGFDDFYGFLGGGHNYFPKQFKAEYEKQKANGNTEIRDYITPLEFNGKEVDENEYITDALSREAVNFIDRANQKEKPFFLYLSYNAPHTPLEAKEEDVKHYQHIKDKKRRIYAGMVHAVDRGIANVVETLRKNKQLDNTLIVFFSDNGGKLSKGATNFPLTAGKGSTHEGGYRVPMFFHWPNVVPSGVKFQHPVSALDLYPTLTSLGKAELPTGKILDGKDIWADFLAGKNPYQDKNIYALRHRIEFDNYTDVGVRKNNWKALKVKNNNWTLYDLDNDPGEENNLSKSHPELLENLVEETKKWSETNQQPLWFHNERTYLQWEKNNMPHFEQTFKIK